MEELGEKWEMVVRSCLADTMPYDPAHIIIVLEILDIRKSCKMVCFVFENTISSTCRVGLRKSGDRRRLTR